MERNHSANYLPFFFMLTAVICVIFICPRTIYAYSSDIRIGLESKYKDVDSVKITAKTIEVGYDKGIAGYIKGSGSFTAEVVNDGFVKYNESYNDFDAANAAAVSKKSAGVNAIAALVENGKWTVYARSSNPSSDAARLGGIAMQPNTRRVQISDNGNALMVFENALGFGQLNDADSETTALGTQKYRGHIELNRHTGKRITVVNVVTLDEYLYSVIPSEFPSKWSNEAMKAQVVATRSYTVTRLGVHKELGYDICDTTNCQVYLGAGNEAATTTQAVKDTTGQILIHNGGAINAVYFSSSGGVTDDSENVWANAEPYLRSVKEITEFEPKQWTRTFTLSELTDLANKNKANIGSVQGVSITTSDNGRVQSMTLTGSSGNKTYKKEEIRSFFSPSAGGMLESRNFRLAGYPAPNITQVQSTGAPQGTPTTVTQGSAQSTSAGLYATNGTQTVSLQANGLYVVNSFSQIVQISGGIAVDKSGNSVDIATAANAAAQQAGTQNTGAQSSGAISATVSGTYTAPTGGSGTQSVSGKNVVLTGNGWGHGVGMSQRGAEGMAQMGYNYMQILQHYYTGTQIQQL